MTKEEIEELYVEEPNCFETDREESWYKVGLKEGLAVAIEYFKENERHETKG